MPWKQVSSSETACHPGPRRNNTIHRTSRHRQSRTLRIIRDTYQAHALLYTCRRGSPALSTCDSRFVPAARNTRLRETKHAGKHHHHLCLGGGNAMCSPVPWCNTAKRSLMSKGSVPTKCNKDLWIPYSLRNALTAVFASWFLASHVVVMHSRMLDAGSCGVLAGCNHVATLPCVVRTCASFSSSLASIVRRTLLPVLYWTALPPTSKSLSILRAWKEAMLLMKTTSESFTFSHNAHHLDMACCFLACV